ncbi:MAG: hypothetical protein CME62_00480 [Halobacteriovoraceae bacterium]|nr:hypothetical protein [Halobacteriovoraceae bacterium]|tara:strand:- start:12773 stop:13606 length:834 start_codon:yes stop_codon:yes gene_type:complete
MKCFLGLLPFLILGACKTGEEKYLYDENSPNIDDIRQYAQAECIREATFFSKFDSVSEFDDAAYEVGDIYKISQDDNSATIIYAKIIEKNATDVRIAFNSTTSSYKKYVVYEESDHEDLGSFLEGVVCDSNYEDYFPSASGLTSSTLKFVWKRETIETADSDDDDDDIADAYHISEQTLSVNINYPSFFYFYNGSKVHKYDIDDTDDENKELVKTSKITIESISASDCTSSACDFSHTTPLCNIVVDPDGYKQTNYSAKAFTTDNTSACNFLLSDGF